MIKIYRETKAIKAEQFDGSDEMVDRLLETDYVTPNMGIDDETNSGLLFANPRGYLELKVGDWIVTESNDKYRLIIDSDFKQQYAELPVIPQGVAHAIGFWKKSSTLFGVLSRARFSKHYSQTDGVREVWAWIIKNCDDFARAWLDGYRVENDE